MSMIWEEILMEKKIIASVMAIMMIVSMYFLARLAAVYTIAEKDGVSADKSQTGQDKRGQVIVIDAGHGGSDPGKVGVNGVLEKDINLAIAKLLQQKLTEAGFDVVMTREEDQITGSSEGNHQSGKAADMHKRIDIINGSGACALISIHQNSFSSASAKGPQIFYYATSTEGKQLANVVQEQLNTDMSVERPRQIKANDNYYLLKRSEITAIIVECGFLSNEQEAGNLCEDAYQQKLAESICKAIVSYYDSEA